MNTQLQATQLQATLNNQALTMSSLEIKDLTGKRHADVLRDIENMFNQLDITQRTFSSSYKDSTGRTLKAYSLDHDLSLTLIAGYNVKLRMTIIKRWRELEAAQIKPMTQTQIMLMVTQ